MILFFIVITLYFVIFLRYRKSSIYYLPIMDTLVIISRISSPMGSYSRWAVLLNFSRILATLFIYLWIIFTQQKKGNRKITYSVIIFVLYLYIITFVFSSNPWESFKITLRFSTAILGIVAGITYFRTLSQLYKLLNSIYVVLILFIINTIICSIFKIGEGGFYHQASIIFTGGIWLWDVYFVSYSILTYPLLFSFFKKRKVIIIVTMIITILILILTIKRTLVTIVFMGFLIEFLLSKRKIKYFQRIIIIILLSFIILFFFFGDIHKAITARESDLSENILTTQRAEEYSVIIQEFKNQRNPRIILLGRELFNSSGYFGHEQNIYHLENRRIIHSDYANILWGGGIVGIILYLNIFLQIILYMILKKRIASKYPIFYSIYIVIWMFVIGLFINSFSDGILNFSARMIPFLLLGALFGVLKFNLSDNSLLKDDKSKMLII